MKNRRSNIVGKVAEDEAGPVPRAANEGADVQVENVAGDDFNILEGLELFPKHRHERVIELDSDDAPGAAREKLRQLAAARAHFEHPVFAARLERVRNLPAVSGVGKKVLSQSRSTRHGEAAWPFRAPGKRFPLTSLGASSNVTLSEFFRTRKDKNAHRLCGF